MSQLATQQEQPAEKASPAETLLTWQVHLFHRDRSRLPVIGLVMLPTAIVAGLLVVYFEWRAKLLNPIREERHEHRKAA